MNEETSTELGAYFFDSLSQELATFKRSLKPRHSTVIHGLNFQPYNRCSFFLSQMIINQ